MNAIDKEISEHRIAAYLARMDYVNARLEDWEAMPPVKFLADEVIHNMKASQLEGLKKRLKRPPEISEEGIRVTPRAGVEL